MRWQDLARFHTRAAGVFLLCLGILSLLFRIVPFLYQSRAALADDGDAWIPYAVLTVPPVLYVLSGLALIHWGGRIVARIERAGTFELRAVERVLLSVLGVYFLAAGAIDGVGWLTHFAVRGGASMVWLATALRGMPRP